MYFVQTDHCPNLPVPCGLRLHYSLQWCTYLLVEVVQYCHVVCRQDEVLEVALRDDELKLSLWLHLQFLPYPQDMPPSLEEHCMSLVLRARVCVCVHNGNSSSAQ